MVKQIQNLRNCIFCKKNEDELTKDITFVYLKKSSKHEKCQIHICHECVDSKKEENCPHKDSGCRNKIKDHKFNQEETKYKIFYEKSLKIR